MKVYELISELMKIPAGCDVRLCGIRTVAELKSEPIVDTDEYGEDSYSVSGILRDLDLERDQQIVNLYF